MHVQALRNDSTEEVLYQISYLKINQFYRKLTGNPPLFSLDQKMSAIEH